MKYAIILAVKRRCFALDMMNELAALCSKASPFHANENSVFYGLTKDRSIFFFFSSNEGKASELVRGARKDSKSNVLNFYYGDEGLANESLVLPDDALHRYVNSSNGRFSLISINIETNAIAAATTISRIDPIYKFENDNLIAIGTWAYSINEILAKLNIKASGSSHIYPFLNAGFFGNDDTFYNGIKAIRPFCTIYVCEGVLNENYEFAKMLRGDAGNNFEDLKAEGYYNKITQEFIKGIQTFDEQELARIQLSGGKDSRLVIAGLWSAGLNVAANTTDGGSHNFTDVYCAKLVAQELGVSHTLTKTAQAHIEATISPDEFHKRTVDVLKATDFGLISLGNLTYNPAFKEVRVFNGLGGELLRGGYSKGLGKQRITYNPHSLLISKWGRFHKFFYEHASDSYSEYLAKWLDENGLAHDFELAADAAYLYCRMGRWAAALTRSGSLARKPTYPLLDNSFLHSVYSAPVHFRSNDRLLYEVLKRLNPSLADLPLANDYWAFLTPDQVNRMRAKFPDAFRERGDKKSGANLDWRANWVEVISEHLLDFILSHPTSRVFDVVDLAQVERLRNSNLNYGHRFLLFGIYSAVIASSVEFSSGVYSGIDCDYKGVALTDFTISEF